MIRQGTVAVRQSRIVAKSPVMTEGPTITDGFIMNGIGIGKIEGFSPPYDITNKTKAQVVLRPVLLFVQK